MPYLPEREWAVERLGVNFQVEVLEAGQVTDCYLGLLLPPPPRAR